mgnify:CR=1 FL=1
MLPEGMTERNSDGEVLLKISEQVRHALRYLLSRGFWILFGKIKGWNVLPVCWHYDNGENLLQVIQLLVESRVDLDCRAKNGSTLLQRVARNGYHKSCFPSQL